MTIDTFFEKFELFADAPDAVAKMRQLVLDLAVQGRLVQQDTADEVVEHLLARNDEARRAAAKIDRRADAEKQPVISAHDCWTIPESWTWRALADLVLFVDYRGKTPAKLSNGIRLITAKNVRKGEINLAPEEFLSEEEYRAWMTRGFPKTGDVLFTTEAPMGNAALVKISDRFALAQRVICFQSYGAVDSSFLVLQILSRQFQAILDKNGTGVTAKGIKASKLKQLPIALPPLAEQERIVAKVDELMALCDRLEAQQQERETRHAGLARASLARFADAPTPANLNLLFHSSFSIQPSDLRKSILTLAVQGKLVHRVESEGIGSDILELAGVTVEPPHDVPDLPDHWMWARLGSIATRMDSGWSPACIPEPAAKGEWGVLKTTAVQTLQYQEVQNKALPPNLEPRPEHEVMDGDILFTRAGPMNRVGILCVARPTRKKLMISDKIIRFHLVRGMDPDFAALSMNAGHSSSVVEGLKSGMAASQVNISQPKLRSVPIPIPPLAEQRRIVAKVEQLMALVDALETQLAAARATAARLLDALVAELTGTTAKTSVSSASGTGRRGRPRKSS